MEHPARLVKRVATDAMALTGSQVNRETVDLQRHQRLKYCLVHQSNARAKHQTATPVHQVPKDPTVHRENPVHPAKTENQATKGPADHPDHRDHPDLREIKVHRAKLVASPALDQVLRVHQALLENPEHPVQLVILGNQGTTGIQAHPVLRENPARQAALENPAHRVHREKTGAQEVAARAITVLQLVWPQVIKKWTIFWSFIIFFINFQQKSNAVFSRLRNYAIHFFYFAFLF